MKACRNYLYLFLVICTFGSLAGCTNDDPQNPHAEINFTPTDETVTLAPGDTMKPLTIKVFSPDKIKSFTILKAGLVRPVQYVTNISGVNFQTVLRDSVETSKKEGDQIVYTITAITQKDEITTRTFTILVSTLNTIVAKTLGNQNSTTGGFLNASDGSVMTLSGAAANSDKVDFLFYHFYPTNDSISGGNAATIASPTDSVAKRVYGGTSGIQTWKTRNTTTFKYLENGTAIYDITLSGNQLASTYTGSTAVETSALTGLKIGDTFAFKTVAGKYGIAKVNNLTINSTPKYTSEINLSLRIQR